MAMLAAGDYISDFSRSDDIDLLVAADADPPTVAQPRSSYCTRHRPP
jgi:hypothetical protein